MAIVGISVVGLTWRRRFKSRSGTLFQNIPTILILYQRIYQQFPVLQSYDQARRETERYGKLLKTIKNKYY